MDDFQYRDDILFCEDVSAPEIAQAFGTPLFVYSQHTLLDHYQRTCQAFAVLNATVCFSVKSCQNLSILRMLRARGSSFDVVSGGELARALEAGAEPSSIVYAGVGKTDEEIHSALRAGIGWFNVESKEELDNIGRIAAALEKTASIALRVNPDVDPQTHRYTTTGKRETKFGVDLEQACKVFAEFGDRPGIDLAAIHLHIGSPVNSVQPYVDAIQRTLATIDRLRDAGHAIRAINIGGGFGAHYDGSEAPPASVYAERIVPLLRGKNLQVLLEPGRSIAANAGVLLTRVLYTKQSGDRRFLIVDAAITELLRPALYGAFHFVWPVAPGSGFTPPTRSRNLVMKGTSLVDIVGPVCESSDFLAKNRNLPPVRRNDLLCVFSAGAYGFTMSSQYNSRMRAAEVLVDGDKMHVIRRRECYDDLVALERGISLSLG